MPPTLLIASPQMKDPIFERTVVFVWHHDEDQAIGVVVNRVLEHTLPDVLEMDVPVDLTPYEHTLVGWGGPVDAGSGTVITSGDLLEEEGWILPDGLGVTRSQDALVRLLKRRAPVLLCLGYAGCGRGQLDREIADGGWIWTDVDRSLLFDVPAEERYERALATVGLTSKSLWMHPIQE